MSTEIPYSKRYIYNLDPSILESLKLLYFDSFTFEQKTEKEFFQRRQDEIQHEKDSDTACTVLEKPLIVQPKPRNVGLINTTLSNLKFSETKGVKQTKEGEGEDRNSESEGSDSEHETDTEESDNEQADSSTSSTLSVVKEDNNRDHEDYDSTISFMATKSPLILFGSPLLSTQSGGQCFGIYKTVINAVDSPNFDPLFALKNTTFNAENPMPKDPIESGISAIFMLSSGHFAGAIISHLPHSTKGNKGTPTELQLQSVRLLAHKTFHRYTTRRKQGGSQSAMDDAKGKANSAGSTLRRYNEQALGKDVETLMEEWKPLIDQCSSIFIRGSGKGGKNARGTGLIVRDAKDPKAVIKTGDKRVKMIPFATKRPTTMELKRAWCELSYLKVVDIPSIEKNEIERRRKRDELLNKSKDEKRDDKKASVEVAITNEILLLLKKSKAPAFLSFMRKNRDKFGVNSKLQPEKAFRQTPTALHYASKKGYSFMVQILLVQLHADPTIVNDLGKTAYDIAGDIETRYMFRVARGILGEDCGISWKESHIGSSMSKEDVAAAKAVAKEEMETREAEERQKLKEEHDSLVENFKSAEISRQEQHQHQGKALGGGPGVRLVTEEQKLSGLSEMQRMKVLREQRFRAIEARLKKQEKQ